VVLGSSVKPSLGFQSCIKPSQCWQGRAKLAWFDRRFKNHTLLTRVVGINVIQDDFGAQMFLTFDAETGQNG